jgi:hypothetical protein
VSFGVKILVFPSGVVDGGINTHGQGGMHVLGVYCVRKWQRRNGKLVDYMVGFALLLMYRFIS